jgi:ABC-type glycerol-3-phosphate transport system substrate-binding protein
MGEKQNLFQIGLLILFGALALISVAVIAIYRTEGTVDQITQKVIIWGPPFSDDAINNGIEAIVRGGNEAFKNVVYVEKHPSVMYNDLLETLSSGDQRTIPELIVFNAADLPILQNKLLPLSYEGVPMHEFNDTWVEGAQIFALNEGVYAFPLLVDPLVLYWNRDLFTNEAIAQPPKDWDTFVNLVPKLTKIKNSTDLIQSAVAFGEHDNVLHANKIVSALLMQTGVSIVNEGRDGFETHFKVQDKYDNPAVALRFYTSFANPINVVYSWNKTFNRSREAFAANEVAMYAGFVSEEKVLSEINPNLNFGMSIFPQANNSKTRVTYGDFYGIGLIKANTNSAEAYLVALEIAKKSNIVKVISESSQLPSARNDLLTSSVNPEDPFSKTKTQSAIMSRSWVAVQSPYVDDSFSRVINGIVSGSMDANSGVKLLDKDIEATLTKY